MMTTAEPAATKRVAALIVSGFLGSGKTTLVRRLLNDAKRRGLRLAVVSNEFGDLGIDKALIGENHLAYVELEGGCVCCQLSNELRDTLEALRRQVDPDQILVETSGVALPGQTQLTFWREPVNTWVDDDVALVVVNAEQVYENRDLDGTFADQVTSADLILLNKIDLIPPPALPAVEARLRAIEPDAPILRAEHGDVDPAVLFPPDLDGLRALRRAGPEVDAPHTHDQFTSREIVVEDGIEPRALLSRLRGLHALRLKGFVATRDGVRLVQGVASRIEIAPPPGPVRPDLLGRLVVIERSSIRGATQ